MIPGIDQYWDEDTPVIPYGPGTPYATVNDLPENCVFLAPNGGVHLKQGGVITPVSANLVYNGEAVTYGGVQLFAGVLDFGFNNEFIMLEE